METGYIIMSDWWKYFLGFLSGILIPIINWIGRIIIRYMELRNEIKKIKIKNKHDIVLMEVGLRVSRHYQRKKITRKNNGNYIKEWKKYRNKTKGEKNEKRISNK